jgi:hypothetical protein
MTHNQIDYLKINFIKLKIKNKIKYQKVYKLVNLENIGGMLENIEEKLVNTLEMLENR